MPSRSLAQRKFFAMLEHNPELRKERGINLSKAQLHDFVATPQKNLPQHVSRNFLKRKKK